MGEFIPKVSGMFPNQEVFARGVLSFDSSEDEKAGMPLRSWVEIEWSLRTMDSMRFTYTALHALKEGYEVYGLIDAAGDLIPEDGFYEIN